MRDVVRVVLAKHYDLVVGDTFQLFYRGIIEAVNPYCYDILAVCEVGRNYPRYFEYTPDSAGCHLLTVTVFANDKTVLAQGETTLCVHEAVSQPQKPVNILCVGDSLTSGGVWVHEAMRRLTAADGEPCGLGMSGFRFIGSCTKDGAGYEGYGGWQWGNYLRSDKNALTSIWVKCQNDKDSADQHSIWTDEDGNLWQLETIEPARLKLNRAGEHNTGMPKAGSRLRHSKNAQNTADICVSDAYEEIVNPFMNPKTFSVDFKEYCARNGFDGIDAVYFFLTWNGRFGVTKPDEVFCQELVEQGKRLVDIFHSQFPEAKVRIMGLQVPSVTGGCAASYGAQLPYCDDYGLVRFVMELNRAYERWTLEEKYSAFTEFIQISGQFDSEYNMPYAEKRVNTRSMQTEMIGTNGVHPLTEGYLQIADAVYRNLVKTFCTSKGQK